MKKLSKSLFAVVLGLFTFSGFSVAEEAGADKQEIVAACTAEAQGAIDVKEYIESCVKDKEEELKEMAKEAEAAKEKS